MQRFSLPLLVGLLAVTVSTGCIFTVESEMQQAPDAGSDTDSDADVLSDIDADDDVDPEVSPDVSIDGPDEILVDPDDTTTVEYDIDCEPDGCDDDLWCRWRADDDADGDAPEFTACTTTFEATGPFDEGDHLVEVELRSGDAVEAEATHTTRVLYEFDAHINGLAPDDPNEFSHPDYSPRIDVECTHPDCTTRCFWEGDEPTEIPGCAETEPFALEFPSDFDGDKSLLFEACSPREELDNCRERTYQFEPSSPHWTSVDAGDEHTCAILDDHTVWCWGNNSAGQLGTTGVDGSIPTRVDGHHWQQISAGRNHSCGLDVDDTLYCWGNNDFGQLGVDGDDASTPQLVDDGPWQSVTTGDEFSCAIDDDARLFCWGSNVYDQLGAGTEEDSGPELREVSLPSGDGWATVDAGQNHTCATIDIDGDHQGYCWGRGTEGQLGHIDSGVEATPRQIMGDLESPRTWTSLAAASEHTCATTISSDNDNSHCWGDSTEGRLGTGDNIDHEVPAPVEQRSHFHIATGETHSCGLHGDDTPAIDCWGSNYYGQLGTEDGEPSDTPVAIELPGDPAAADLTAGYDHTCAIDEQGRLYCWGYDNQGQLGTPEEADSDTPAELDWPWADFGSDNGE